MNASPDSAAGERTTQPPPAESQRQAASAVPREAIAERAYELYVRRGGEPGRDMEDWLQAEREISRGGEQTS